MDSKAEILHRLEEIRNSCPELVIMLLGETGVGKSTLINNLFRKNFAPEGGTVHSTTSEVRTYRSKIEEVPVSIVDTPGLGDSREDRDVAYLAAIKNELPNVHLIILCIRMTETRIHEGIIQMLKQYNKAGIDWKKTIIALTFADGVKPSAIERKASGFNIIKYFDKRLQHLKSEIRSVLTTNLRVNKKVVDELKVIPTTDDTEAILPNEKEWYGQLWFAALETFPSDAGLRFVDAFRKNINFQSTDSPSKHQAVGEGQPDSMEVNQQDPVDFVAIGSSGCSDSGLAITSIPDQEPATTRADTSDICEAISSVDPGEPISHTPSEKKPKITLGQKSDPGSIPDIHGRQPFVLFFNYISQQRLMQHLLHTLNGAANIAPVILNVLFDHKKKKSE